MMMFKYLLFLVAIVKSVYALEWTDNLRASVTAHKETLTQIRAQVFFDLFEAPAENQKDIKEIAHSCTEQMTSLFLSIVDLFKDDLSYTEQNGDTRTMAIALLGSGATYFMTPFSDIEFVIFVDRIRNKEDPFKKQLLKFVKKLADYVEAFGESGFLNDPNPVSGFRLDEHNIPPYNHSHGKMIGYGRQSRQLKQFGNFLLISTPKFLYNSIMVTPEIMHSQNWFEGNPKKTQEYTQTLSSFRQVLRTTRHVYGSQELTNTFEKLFTISDMEQASLESWEKNISAALKNPHLFPFLFPHVLSFPEHVDLKKQMLRLPEQLITGLGTLYGIQPNNILDVLEQLKTMQNLPATINADLLEELGQFMRVTYLVLCDISYYDQSQCKGPQDFYALIAKWNALKTEESLSDLQAVMSPSFNTLLMAGKEIMDNKTFSL